jgi:hypothetical protein
MLIFVAFRIVLKNDVARIGILKGLPSWWHIGKYIIEVRQNMNTVCNLFLFESLRCEWVSVTFFFKVS